VAISKGGKALLIAKWYAAPGRRSGLIMVNGNAA